jgi:hypothetical protein
MKDECDSQSSPFNGGQVGTKRGQETGVVAAK